MRCCYIRAGRVVVVLLSLGLPLVAAGQSEIYKWTDEHGHVHYSDRAPQSESSETLKLETTNILTSHSEEQWDFQFDNRNWQLGHQASNQNGSVREYVLAQQSVEDWTELVTSQQMNTPLTVEDYFETIMKNNPDCPSMQVSLLHKKSGTIIFQGKHGACGGYEPGEYLQRASQVKGGILLLSFAQEGRLTKENRDNWMRILREATMRHKSREKAIKPESLPLSELGPLPKNTVSKYLETLSTSLAGNFKNRSARFSIRLRARKGLPGGAYLEVHFPNPSDLNKKDTKSKVLAAGESEAFFMSPEYRNIKCWNYEVLVDIYRGDSKTRLLDTHRQVIQSRVNYSRIKDPLDMVSAAKSGRCP